MESFNLEIVAADISEQVTLTYRMFLYTQSLIVKKGMPARVRWRILSDPTRYFFRRMTARVERWLKIDDLSLMRKTEEKAKSVVPGLASPSKRRTNQKRAQTSASREEKSSQPNNGSRDGQ
jgi:ABC-type proline/glycine betaine transport system ATPase subunit